jgi:hypothetical protein
VTREADINSIEGGRNDMHFEAWTWLSNEIRPVLSGAKRVLDFGGCDVNGSPRSLFSPQTQYTVIDWRAGDNVDVIADASKWLPPGDCLSSFDVVLCTEVFEHTKDWRGILYNMWLTAKPVGSCLLTCAVHPRPPHSIVGIEPPPPGEWYQNVCPEDLLVAMRFLFRNVHHAIHPRGDLYIKGVK